MSYKGDVNRKEQAMPHDLNTYQDVICVTCKRKWQEIDFGCARHVLMCSDPQREQPAEKPQPEPQEVMTFDPFEQWT
jgi:hypothetical protein